MMVIDWIIPCVSYMHFDWLARYPPGYFTQELQMDFFNYAGIHRPVLLYTTATEYISDVTIITHLQNTTGKNEY